MTEKQRIRDTLEAAILEHRQNIATAELQAARNGDSVEVSRAISHAEREITRLEHMMAELENGKRVTAADRADRLSAQIGLVQGELLTVKTMLESADNKLNNHCGQLKEHGDILRELRDQCPLFNPDMPEGPLYFKKPDDKGG